VIRLVGGIWQEISGLGFGAAILAVGLVLVGCWQSDSASTGAVGDEAADFLIEDDREIIQQLESLGYAEWAEDVPESTGPTPIEINDADRRAAGINLVLSAHAREAFLMDADGTVLHRWLHGGEPSSTSGSLEAEIRKHWYIRKAELLPTGDLLAILGFPHGEQTPEGYDRVGLVKLDKDSNTIWEYSGKAHHDLDVREDGVILVLTNQVQINPEIDAKHPVLEDYITMLSVDGVELDRVSVYDSLKKGGAHEILDRIHSLASEGHGDILHVNSLEIVDERLADRLPGVNPGDVLISIRETHALAVINLVEQESVWTHTGDFRYQHDATVLDNGNILYFDNRGSRWYSAVRELDPVTGRDVWSYAGNLFRKFRSKDVGASYRLKNGNTLIVESRRGRAFEVTPKREIVWEFINPNRTARDQTRTATLMDLRRIAPDFPLEWLGAPRVSASSPIDSTPTLQR
jgi:hypothetical protein